MSLLYRGPRGSVEQRWIMYALLCDNVQHHVERGEHSGEFPALYGIARALGARSLTLPARQLHAELVRANTLLGRSVSELAISNRTRAVVGHVFPLPAEQHTMLVCDSGVSLPLPGGARTLDDVFGQFLRELLRITGGAQEDDLVEITDL